MIKNIGSLRYTDNSYILDITVRAKNNLRNGTRICNSVRLTSSNASTVSAGGSTGTCVQVMRTGQAAVTTAPPTTGSSTETTAVTESIIPPGLSKQVRNITQNLSGEKATQATVHAGDVLEYTLITYNGSGQTIASYDIKDFVGDVTDYADIDHAFLASQGGMYDKQMKQVMWAGQRISPGQSIIKKFRVKMKGPLPSTNKPSVTSTNFDCKISNQYGNELTMDVQCPAAKLIETLPNTDSGRTILIMFGLASFSGYFLARNRLLGKELLIIRRNYASTGGNK